MVVLAIFMQPKYIFVPNSSVSGRSHIGSLFTNEVQKKLACDVLNISATRVDLVHDVADLGCPTQSASAHGRAFATFTGQF